MNFVPYIQEGLCLIFVSRNVQHFKYNRTLLNSEPWRDMPKMNRMLLNKCRIKQWRFVAYNLIFLYGVPYPIGFLLRSLMTYIHMDVYWTVFPGLFRFHCYYWRRIRFTMENNYWRSVHINLLEEITNLYYIVTLCNWRLYILVKSLPMPSKGITLM